MSTLTLGKIWINRLDTGEAVSAQSADRAQDYEMAGEVRTFAGGRQRAFGRVGEVGQFAFTLRVVSLATIVVLRSWEGIAVQVRDHRGQRFFGTYFGVKVGEHKGTALYDVAIALHVVSVAEGA
jgi:hypothetical protein